MMFSHDGQMVAPQVAVVYTATIVAIWLNVAAVRRRLAGQTVESAQLQSSTPSN